MRMFFLLFFVIPLQALAAIGGDTVGNGGFVFQCENAPTVVVDLHELSSRHFLRLDSEKTGTVKERVLHLLNKLAVYSPRRAAQYQRDFEDFYMDAEFLDDMSFFPTPDLGFTTIPAGCHLELAVFQREPGGLNKARYSINRRVWGQLDVIGQAALILHELIYREANRRENFHPTSEASRVLNAHLNSLDFQKLTPRAFLELLQSLHFQAGEYAGYTLNLGSYKSLQEGWIPHPLSFDENSQQLTRARLLNLDLRIFEFTPAPLQALLKTPNSFFLAMAEFSENKIQELRTVSRSLLLPDLDHTEGLRVMNTLLQPQKNAGVSAFYEIQDVFSVRGYEFALDVRSRPMQVDFEVTMDGKIPRLMFYGDLCREKGTRQFRMMKNRSLGAPPTVVENTEEALANHPACLSL